jgi:hypothetical protein
VRYGQKRCRSILRKKSRGNSAPGFRQLNASQKPELTLPVFAGDPFDKALIAQANELQLRRRSDRVKCRAFRRFGRGARCEISHSLGRRRRVKFPIGVESSRLVSRRITLQVEVLIRPR